jgi:cytochrome P450
MQARNPPGPSDFPFGVHLAKGLRNEPLTFATELARRYADLALFRLGPYRACAVNHPDLIHEVLVTKAASFRKLPHVMRVLGQLDGNGLALSDGDFRLHQRRLLQPEFAVRSLERYANVVVGSTRQLLDDWREDVVFDMADAMMRLSLTILLRTLFNVDRPASQAASICGAVSVLSEILVREMGQPLRLFDWLPLPGKRRKHGAIGILDRLSRMLVNRRGTTEAGHDELLARLLAGTDASCAGRGQMVQQTRDEVMAILHAGHETTAAGLAWIWFLLARYPHVQESLITEVDTVLRGRSAAVQDLPRLSRTEQVIWESLRLYTPTWILFPGQALQETVIGEYRLPRGCWVMIFPYVLHHDSRWFERPEEFDPRRFEPGRRGRIRTGAYIPFGCGAHLCLGRRFVVMVMSLVVVTILERYRVELAPDQKTPEPEPFLALRPKGGVHVRLVKRSVVSPRSTGA